MLEKYVYLDNAATTLMSESVINTMTDTIKNCYGNPSSAHSLGEKSRDILDEARKYILSTLSDIESGSIIFTSGGSESDNLAIKGLADAHGKKHIITSSIEHNAVLKSCRYLEKKGYKVTYIEPDEKGWINPEKIKEAICDDTLLISIMCANNEIGTIEPIKEIGAIAREHGVFFHTDAVQAYGQIPIDVDECNVDLLSVSAHKFHGPRGVGFLYVRNGVGLESLIHGGGQEMGLRAGTENLPAIVGMRRATEEIFSPEQGPSLQEKVDKMTELRDYFIDEILKRFPEARLNGAREQRLPGNINISFLGVSAGKLLKALDRDGIQVSSGSACSSKSGKASHVLEAIKLDDKYIEGAIRFSLNKDICKEDLDYVLESLEKNIKLLTSDIPVNIFAI